MCCSLPCARRPNGNLSSQISTCGKAGSLNSRYMNNGRFIKARQMASGRTFRLGLQMADFILSRTSSLSARPRLGLRMADFISPRIRSLSAAKPSHFLLRARFIKAGQLQWPVCQQCGGQMARSPHSGFAWPISYYPVYGIYQRPGRAIL